MDKLISINDAVALLRRERGVSRTRMHLARLCKQGTLKAQQVGRAYVTTERDVLEWWDTANHVPGTYDRKRTPKN